METITSVFSIPAFRLAGVEAALEKLNRRARRLKIQEITLKVVKAYTVQKHARRDIHCTGPTHPVAYNDIEVTGAHPHLAGWYFAATLEHDAETGLTILRTSSAFNAAPIPTEYRKAKPVCDHCRQNRARKDTFLCWNAEKGFKQIGRNCLQDFLGGRDPHSIAGAAELWFDFTEFVESDCDPDGGWSHGAPIVVSTDEFIQRSFAVTRVRGFLGRVKAREYNQAGDCKVATADRVLNLVLPTAQQREEKDWQDEERETTPNAQDIERAGAALAWVRAFDPENSTLSDYQHNLYVACASELLPLRRAGIAASLPAAYLKHLDKEEELRKQREERKPSNFVGTIGDRIEITAKLSKVITIPDNGFGESYLHKFEAETGDRFAWFSSTQAWDEGQTYTFLGTVKKHSDSPQYGKETLLSRCKEGKAKPKGKKRAGGAPEAKAGQFQTSSIRITWSESIRASITNRQFES